MTSLLMRLLAGAALPLCIMACASMASAQPAPTKVETDAVMIYRDKMGVPHIYGNSGPAVFYGASYAIAQDRLAQAELESRALLGRLAEIAGPDAVDADKMSLLALPSDASIKAQFEQLSNEHQALLRAMHGGWIARVRAVKADPSQLPYEFKEWGIAPSEPSLWDYLKVMGGVLKYYGTGGGGRELTNLAFYRDLVAKHGAAKAKIIFDDVLPLDDPDAVPILPASEIKRAPLTAETLLAQQTSWPLGDLQPTAVTPARRGASRVLLIGAKKSATGNPIILQATADGPDVHISGGGFEAAGYVFATMSPVIQGRTDTLAWSATTGEADLTDIYAERLNPANPRQYFFNGAWRDMAVRKEVIRVKGADPIDFEIESTVHGPVVQRENADHVAYSMKNAMAGKEILGIAGSIELNRAKTFEDYKRASASIVGSANVNYAGTDGRIAIMHVGLQPIRPKGVDPRLPTPGTGEYEWLGFVKDYSIVVDPEQGYLHAWNNKITAEATYGDTSRYGRSFRTWLGRSLAESQEKISRDDVREFHRMIGQSAGGMDLSVTNPRFFTPYLKRAVAGDARLEAAVAAMDSWNAVYEDKDGDGYYDNPGLAVYRAWIDIAQQQVIGDDIGDWWHKLDDASYIKYRTDVLLRAVEGRDAGAPMRYDWYNGGSREAVLRKTVADTVVALEKQYGSPEVKQWRQRVFYRYYDPAAQAANPDKPTRSGESVAVSDSLASLAAGRLGLQPAYITDNGSEDWNMLVEVQKGDPVLYDSTPTGGQNLFVGPDGKGNPNIADQVKLHENFDFKAVDLDRSRVMRDAVSALRLTVPAYADK